MFKSKIKKLILIIVNCLLPAKKRFGIKKGYIHRNSVPHFDDSKLKEEYQKEVYQHTLSFMEVNRLNSICDIGCGSAYKLIKYFTHHSFTGIEIDPTLTYLKENYPNQNWKTLDEVKGCEFDIILLSDVIEHIENPKLFLDKIIEYLSFKYIIISTPDRELLSLASKFGPPKNKHHFREWNFIEFNNFIGTFFKIKSHYISNKQQGTQVIICENTKVFSIK